MNPFGSMMGFGMGPNLFSGGMPFYNPFPRMPMFGGGLGGFGGFGGFGGYGGGMGGGFNPFGSQFGGMGGGFNPFMMSPPPMQRFPRYDSLIPMQSQMPSQSLQDLPYQPKRPEMTSIEQMPRQIIENKEISNRFKESKDQLNNRIRIDDSPIAQLRLRDRLGEQRPPSIDIIAANDRMMEGDVPPIKWIQDPNIRQAPPGGSTWVPPGATTVPESPIPIEEFNRNFRNIMQTDPMSIKSKEDLDNLITGPLFSRQRSDIFEKYSQNPLTQAWEASQSPQDFKKDPAPLLSNDWKIKETITDPRIKPIKEFIEEERPTPSFTPFDPSGLQSRIGDLEGRQMFDPSGLKSRIDALENRQMPAFTPFDPSGLQSRLDALENRQMPSYTPFDPAGLQSRLGTLENRQMFDPSGLQSQIDALQNRQMPMFDSSGLQSRLNALEGRVQKTGNLNMTDIEALIEQRLSDSLRNMNPVNQGNQITYDPTLISEIQKNLPPPIKEYNDRLFIGQGGPYDI